MIRTATLWATVALLATEAMALRQICTDRYGRRYYCNSLSLGARIAIGVCSAIGILLIFLMIGCIRRKKLAAQWKQYRPPPPVSMAGGSSDNPYGANPPPPTYANGGNSGYARNSIGADTPAPPPATYQPSAANNYGGSGTGAGGHGLASSYYGNNTNPSADAQHSYEYEQQQRMDAEKYGTNSPQSPPGYDLGGGPGTQYASPTGPPPAAGNQYASPTGPPPKM